MKLRFKGFKRTKPNSAGFDFYKHLLDLKRITPNKIYEGQQSVMEECYKIQDNFNFSLNLEKKYFINITEERKLKLIRLKHELQ